MTDQNPTAPQYPYQPPPPAPRKRHTWRNIILATLGVMTLVVVIAAVAASGSNPKITAANTGTSAPAAAAPAAAPVTPAPVNTGPLGTTYTDSGTSDGGNAYSYTVTLNQVLPNATPDNEFDAAPSGEVLVGAEFTITGVTGTSSDDANSDATAIGSNGETYTFTANGLAAGTNFNYGDFNVSPGVTSVGWVAFDVPAGVTVSSIVWSPDFSGVSATWTLG